MPGAGPPGARQNLEWSIGGAPTARVQLARALLRNPAPGIAALYERARTMSIPASTSSSFGTLLAELATLTRNRIIPTGGARRSWRHGR